MHYKRAKFSSAARHFLKLSQTGTKLVKLISYSFADERFQLLETRRSRWICEQLTRLCPLFLVSLPFPIRFEIGVHRPFAKLYRMQTCQRKISSQLRKGVLFKNDYLVIIGKMAASTRFRVRRRPNCLVACQSGVANKWQIVEGSPSQEKKRRKISGGRLQIDLDYENENKLSLYDGL